MRISRISIKKFRKLENVEDTFGLVNEFYGSNASGKTSELSFITWVLYGETLDLDKKEDENIDVNKPYELISGTVYLIDNNEEYSLTREYGYKEDGTKVNTFFVNGRKCGSQKEYYQAINSMFKLDNVSTIKIKDLNIQRAFSDPYYLPNKEEQFRELITKLINVDTYSILFNSEKYLSIKSDFDKQGKDYDKCNDYYNQTLSDIASQEIKLNATINAYGVVNYSEKKENELLDRLNSIKKDNVSCDELNAKAEEYNNALDELGASKLEDTNNIIKSENELKLDELKTKCNNLINKYNSMALNNDNMVKCIKIAKDKIKYLEEELAKEKAKTFVEIKCHNCGAIVNESGLKEFNKNKVETTKKLRERIEIANKEVSSYVGEDLSSLENEINSLKLEISKLKDIVSNTPKETKSQKTKDLEVKVEKLKNEYSSLRLDYDNKVSTINNVYEEKVKEINDSLFALKIEKDKKAKLDELIKNKATLLSNKAIIEARQSLLKSYRLDEIAIVKEKTSLIFGDEFEFEMLKKNVTNDNYKRVCTASINGVRHIQNNTAMYVNLSIKMLEKLKEFIGGCTMPILFDIVDNIGNTARNTIFENIKNSQVFYTRIADEDGVARKVNIIKENN